MKTQENIDFTPRENREEILHKSLSELKIMSEEDVATFYKNGVYTLCGLLSLNLDAIYNLVRDNYTTIRRNIMNLGLLFESDERKYKAHGITKEVALIPINSLEMSQATKNRLARSLNIFFLGDLLVTDYSLLERARNFGKNILSEIKNCVHSLGFTLLNEEISIEEIKAQYHAKGITTIQDDLQLDSMTSSILFRNGIHTLDDLLAYGYKVFELTCMGPVRKQKLEEAMKRNNIHFDSCIPTQLPDKVNPTKKLIEQLKTQNEEIKQRVETKKTLVLEYERLIKEKTELLEIERRLDKKIASKITLLDSLNKKGQPKL